MGFNSEFKGLNSKRFICFSDINYQRHFFPLDIQDQNNLYVSIIQHQDNLSVFGSQLINTRIIHLDMKFPNRRQVIWPSQTISSVKFEIFY